MEIIKILVDWNGNFGAATTNEDVAVVVTGTTLAEMKSNMEESLRLHIEWMKEEGDIIPSEFLGEYTLEYELSPRALMHHAESFVSRSALAKESGIPSRQLGHYYTGIKQPRPQQVERIKTGLRSIISQLSALSL